MITKRKPINLAVFTTVVVMLAACGQKGALYLPKDEQKAKTEQTENKQSEQEKKDNQH